MGKVRPLWLIAFCCWLVLGPGTATAEPEPPQSGQGITILGFGVMCDGIDYQLENAPETQLGQVRHANGIPTFVTQGQQVPQVPGVAFGLTFRSDRNIPGATFMLGIPDRPQSDRWTGDVIGGIESFQSFFNAPDYIPPPGIYALEAWEGDAQLYRIEFELVPAGAMPGIGSKCGLVS